ncbi:hypothetical protein F5883DRAFT_707220 [Diaporthe sp. PMI_573]|nr:hypothetical protein F5883DRAFT_707220 [Diaporthaceae sp. PMI_573]
MPAIPIDTRAISQELGKHLNYYVARSTQELGEHLNYYVARSIDHRALEVIAVLATIIFGVGGYMYYAIKVQSK